MKKRQSAMTTEEWFKQSLEALKNDPEFLFEEAISLITNKICKIMKDHKINRTQLANKLEISPPAVTRMLDGNPNFTLKRLVSVADALGQELIVDFKPKHIAVAEDKQFCDRMLFGKPPQRPTAGATWPSVQLQTAESSLPTAESTARETISAA